MIRFIDLGTQITGEDSFANKIHERFKDDCEYD